MITSAMEIALARVGQFAASCPSCVDFVGPQPTWRIRNAEEALGIKFPPTYTQFLASLGAGGIGSEEFCGLVKDDFTLPHNWDVVWSTNKERCKVRLPRPLIVINYLGEGTLFALNSNSKAFSLDYPVVAWRPGIENEDECELVAECFGDFFLKKVEIAIANVFE